MNIIIFGATGTIGQHLVKGALAADHRVTAFARNPDKTTSKDPNLSLYPGDVFDSKAVNSAVKGQDCVFIVLGSTKLTGNVRSVGTRNILDAMEQHGVRRVICQTTLGTFESRGNLNFFWKYIMFGMFLRFVYQDHKVQEEMIKRSNLDWTIVRPAAFIDDLACENYKHGFPSTEKKLALKIPRIDVASFMLRQLTDNTYLRQTPGLSC